MDGELVILVQQRVIEIDDALHEAGLEDADAAEIQKIDRAVRPHGVIAQMRIAMDDAVEIEGHIPGAEHVVGDLVAHRLIAMRLDERQQRRALKPVHGEEAPGR